MSGTYSWLQTVLPVIILLLVEGFFSGSEIALISADKVWLKRKIQEGSRSARRALSLAKHPEQILSTTLFMTSLSVIAISGLLAGILPEIQAIALSSFLVVIFGELIPKTIFRKHANKASLWVAFPLEITYLIFYPVTRFLSLYTHRVSKFVGPMEALFTGKRNTSRDELRSMIEYGKKDSEIKSSEKQMIKRIFDFRFTESKSVLIPLVKVDAIEESASILEAIDEFKRHRHSRIPVYSERIDNIVGILEFFDLFAAKDLKLPVRNYMSRCEYVAAAQNLPDVLVQMHQNKREMVVIVDEHGGAIGVLTSEDIFEEVAGDIADEYDNDSLQYRVVDDDKWIVQARMEVTRINEQLKLELPEGEYETLAGFLLKQFGRIPLAQDELFFMTGAGLLKFTIRIATHRHIESVLIERLESPDNTSSEN